MKVAHAAVVAWSLIICFGSLDQVLPHAASGKQVAFMWSAKHPHAPLGGGGGGSHTVRHTEGALALKRDLQRPTRPARCASEPGMSKVFRSKMLEGMSAARAAGKTRAVKVQRQAEWNDACERWSDLYGASSRIFRVEAQDYYIVFLYLDTQEMRFGRINKVVAKNEAYVEIADDVFILLKTANAVWSFVPDEALSKAETVVRAAIDVEQALIMISSQGVRLVIAQNAAQGLFGSARVTSALANLGGGSRASGGAGMIGGIIVVAAAPSRLTAEVLYDLAKEFENDPSISEAVWVGGNVGSAAGVVVSVAMVSRAGVSSGLSAAGITSGLAALGAEAGMIGGLATVASTAVGITILVTGVAYVISKSISQQHLKGQLSEMREIAVKLDFVIKV